MPNEIDSETRVQHLYWSPKILKPNFGGLDVETRYRHYCAIWWAQLALGLLNDEESD